MRRAFWSFIFVATLAAAVPLVGQVVVDKTVATVSDGSRTELITRSDLVWQIALTPGQPVDPPRETDLRDALQTQINQRIFALEAERLPRAAPDNEEIAAMIADNDAVNLGGELAAEAVDQALSRLERVMEAAAGFT